MTVLCHGHTKPHGLELLQKEHIKYVVIDAQLLSQEIYNICKFMSLIGFSEKLSLQLIKNFAPKQYAQNNVSFEEQNDNLPKIWISLPFIGKHGTNLIRKFKRKVLPLLKNQCKFIVNWDTTTTTELYVIYLEIGLQYLVSQESVRKNMAICDAFYVTIFLFLWRTPLA